MKLINPVERFSSKLAKVQNPSSYIGGEIGSIIKNISENDSLFNFGIAFPDTYAIGMSNQAIKIIYQGANKQENVRCERVFCPDSDFESLLKETDTPLYTLENGIPLKNLDMLGFSIGYELGITGVLSILENGKIPLLKEERTEEDPIIIAGGVGATNPAVFSIFFDAVYIGEAENEMFILLNELGKLKKEGKSRSEILKYFSKNPHVWTENMSLQTCGHDKAIRAVYENFAEEKPYDSFFPLPNIKPVQDHGVAEIMRGCPNGCRFCHAGVYYRPQRARSRKTIIDYCDKLVNEAGYSQISLTSLSSADYPEIDILLKELNEKFASRNVSFQLPSLKVNSFTLPLLEQLSEVRKSGLTFAVETPEETWQLMLNKEVYAQHLISLINEAKKLGWNKAKFYFMVGLPLPENEITEEKAIVDFMLNLQKETRIQCNVNVGTFIPKPHTAYQWVRQISPEESDRKLRYIRENLPKGKFKVGTHDIATSFVEGLVSRGDKRAGYVIYNAYKKGCRLDAWEENLRRDLPLWEDAFNEADYDVKNEILRERSKEEVLPWDNVSLGVSKNFYLKEFKKGEKAELTPPCKKDCDHKCGVCNNKVSCNVSKNEQKVNSAENVVTEKVINEQKLKQNIPLLYRVVFKFSKVNGGQFFSHLATVEMFNRAIQKSKLNFCYTQGFNPLPKLEFASTLSIGVESEDEYASAVLYENTTEKEFIDSLNKELVDFIQIKAAFIFPITNQRRRESLSASLWGNSYIYSFDEEVVSKMNDFFKSEQALPFIEKDSLCEFEKIEDSKNQYKITLVFQKDRPFRNALEDFFGKKIYDIASIKKIKTFAKPVIMGWTAELNTQYAKKITENGILKANELLKNKVIQPEQNIADSNKIEYFELYKKIALINEKLIQQRKENSHEG